MSFAFCFIKQTRNSDLIVCTIYTTVCLYVFANDSKLFISEINVSTRRAFDLRNVISVAKISINLASTRPDELDIASSSHWSQWLGTGALEYYRRTSIVRTRICRIHANYSLIRMVYLNQKCFSRSESWLLGLLL